MDKMLKMLPNETEFGEHYVTLMKGNMPGEAIGELGNRTQVLCPRAPEAPVRVSFGKSSSCSSAMTTRGQHGPSFCSFCSFSGPSGVEG